MLTFDSNTSIEPVHYDFECHRYATFIQDFTWTDKDTHVAVDLTDVDIEMIVYNRDKESVITLSVDNGRITKDDVNGKFILRLNASETSTLPIGQFSYDLFVDGVHKFLYGDFEVFNSVTV